MSSQILATPTFRINVCKIEFYIAYYLRSHIDSLNSQSNSFDNVELFDSSWQQLAASKKLDYNKSAIGLLLLLR